MYGLLFLLLLNACAHGPSRVCEHIEIHGARLTLSGNEKVLVCGTQKDKGPWQQVPIPQAQYQLSVLLQNEGYLTPRFERNKDRLTVWAGERSHISELVVRGDSKAVDARRKRQVVGEPMTPAKLDEVQQWADTTLRSLGYGCPSVAITAQAWDRKVVANITSGPKTTVASVKAEGLEGIDPEALSRYEAFSEGDLYDVRKTQISVSRMLTDGVIQSGSYWTGCRGDTIDTVLRASIGPPRIFRFEVGASTEEFPFASVTFRNARLDDKVSSYTATVYASPRIQSITGLSQLYWFPQSTRTFLGPRARVARISEQAFEFLEAKAGADLGRLWDMWHTRWVARVGPTLNYVKTISGLGPTDASFLSWEGSVQAMSHNYEASLRNQYRGQREGLGSEVSVNRYDLLYKFLWNMGDFAPPLFVLGVRMELNAVDTPDFSATTQAQEIIPIEYRIFYGGADNLRGFPRKSLTNGDLGYLSAAYTGIELRLVEQMPWNIQPLLLLDIARLGAESMRLDDPIFTSSGVGVRWASPFGTLRGSAARGKIHNENATTAAYRQEWVYFVSFGQEF